MPPTPYMTGEDLLRIATEITTRLPGARLVKNQIGNVGIYVPDADEYVGWIDLRFGEVDWIADPPESDLDLFIRTANDPNTE